MDKFTWRHLASFGLALSVILCASTIFYASQSTRQQRYLHTQYENQLSVLVNSLNQLETSLEKTRYLPQGAMRETLAADIWSESQLASVALAALPLGEQRLEKVESYLSQVGDYAYYLMRSSVYGRASEDEWETLCSLYANASRVLSDVNQLKESIDTGNMRFVITQPIADTAINDSFIRLNDEFPAYASLIYDGPYSDHVSQRKPLALDGQNSLTAEQAADKAAKLLQVSPADVSFDYESNGQIPCYGFSGSGKTVTISKQGGFVLSLTDSKAIGSMNLSMEQAIQKASDFLKTIGLPDMTHSYYEIYETIAIINFHSFENNCIAYPDLIKVGVALDDGSIVRLDTAGFAMNYHSRQSPNPSVSLEQAREQIPANLTIESENLVYIPTTGYREVLCWEFVCKSTNERNTLLYVNCENGEIENILLLLETENGMLTR